MDAHRAQGEVLEQDMRNNSGVNVVSEGSITGAVQFVVVPGENIAKKIYEFIEQHDDQGMFVAEADGCVTTLTIPDLGISGGLVTLMGHFEIISLSGISVNKESCDGKIQRYTNLTVVALDRVNGLVGGSVNGPLIAASPVKVKSKLSTAYGLFFLIMSSVILSVDSNFLCDTKTVSLDIFIFKSNRSQWVCSTKRSTEEGIVTTVLVLFKPSYPCLISISVLALFGISSIKAFLLPALLYTLKVLEMLL